MSMDMVITFPGSQKVYADYKGFTVQTDQPKDQGGDGSAPSPFDLFLVSIGTCAGVYVNQFCRNRDIVTDNIKLILSLERDTISNMVKKIKIDIKLPSDFPEKYLNAIKSAVELCTVKKHIQSPPEFIIAPQIEK